MKKIEIGLKDIFREPNYLAIILSNLNKEELYTLIGCSFIHLLKHYLNGEDIELNSPKEFKDVINRIWKNVEKDLLLGYNNSRK